MDSMKRDSCHLNSPPTEANMPSENVGVELVETKRRKQDAKMDPLKMGSILEIILGFLDVNSVKAARQVNELWSAEGAKILISKCHVRIPSNVRIWKSKRKNNKLYKFKAFLSYKLSEVSMISKIIIDAVKDVELWKSWGVLGQQVESVKWNISDDDKLELLQNLLDLVPNLKHLDFKDCKPSKRTNSSTLKVLTSLMSKPEKNGKLLVVSSISLNSKDVKEFEDIEKFSDCKNIMIEYLNFEMHPVDIQNIPQFKARAAVVLSKLLSTSQNTLKALKLFSYEIYLSLVQFSCMNVLTVMALSSTPATPNVLCEPKFSPCFRFSEKVPKLDGIYISCGVTEPGPADNNFANLFENTGVAHSVKSLTIMHSNFSAFDIAPILQTFPNTEHYSFNSMDAEQARSLFHSLFNHRRNIKTLDFMIILTPLFGEVTELDSILTGFAPETVNKIRNSPKSTPYTSEELASLRVNPSILDLKELKAVKIYFTGFGGMLFFPKRTLAVAGEFAFKLMPEDSKIVIRVPEKAAKHAETALDEVSKLPNVTLEF